MAIASGIVGLGGHDEADGIGSEIVELTPRAGRHDDTVAATLDNEGLRPAAIVDVNDETSCQRKQGLMAVPMGVTAATLAGRNVRDPEYTGYREGDVALGLGKGQNAPIVNILRELQP